jgi:hypothetical protein
MKILIVGDSFAADWTVKYSNNWGWPNQLAEQHDVVNLAQAGVGEYKILKQIQSVRNIQNYDCVIVSHTSPLRVNTRQHPVHHNDKLHHNADLMLNDVEYHYTRWWRWLNPFNNALQTARNFFFYHFDEQYQNDIYTLLRKEINCLIGSVPCVVISNPSIDSLFITEDCVINIVEIQQKHSGLINHLSTDGNALVFDIVSKTLESIRTISV